MSIDVLFLEWTTSPSRDRLSSSLVANYLKQQKIQIKQESIFNFRYSIIKHKPKVVFFSNSVGGSYNILAANFARKMGCKIISGSSEGNFFDNGKEGVRSSFWGHNKSEVLNQETFLVWSQRARQLVLKYFPATENHVLVSGAIGFDQYAILKSDYINQKLKLLTKYNKNTYKKVIGLGCWDFGPLFPEDSRFKNLVINKNEIEQLREEMSQFNFHLRQIIKQNSDILFILKLHPGMELSEKYAGIEGCSVFENTLIIKDEEPVGHVIGASDIWLIFDSTTALEAWLLNKPTIILNPLDVPFNRERVIRSGSPIINNHNELQKLINEFYSIQKINAFEELNQKRESAITEVIGSRDGLNHVRVGNIILNELQRCNFLEFNKIILLLNKPKAYLYLLLFKFSYLFKSIPRLQHLYFQTKKWNFEELELFESDLARKQLEYYSKLNLNSKSLIDYKPLE